MKIAVIGAGSTYTPQLIKELLEISGEIPIDEVSFYDINPEKLKIVHEFSERLVKEKLKIVKSSSFDDAVKDAEFVVFQFRPGGLEKRLKDETVPLKYDLIGQETTGVGGFASALRAFPVVARYIKIISSTGKPWIINFTNPSGHITEFVVNYLEYEKFIGLCNIPINIIKRISETFGVKMDDVFLKYYGLNHLTFVEKIYVNEKDVTEIAINKISYTPENIQSYAFENEATEILNLLLNPYLKYYLYEKKIVSKLKESVPRAKEVMKIEKELLEIYKTANTIPEKLKNRGGSMYSTACAYLIRDLTLGNGKIHIINTKNCGAISNLPDDYVLEIPVYVKGKKLFPISLGKAELYPAGLIHTLKTYERLTIEAYLEKSKRKALQSLLLHPLGPDLTKANELLDEIIAYNDFSIFEQ